MKKTFFIVTIFMAVCLMGVSFTSCSNPEEGEDWDTWVIRNMLNNGWSLSGIKVNGEWIYSGDPSIKDTPEYNFYFEMNLRADGRRFEAHRFFYKDDVYDESTEIIKTGTFTLDSGTNTIEGTDSDGQKFFRLVITDKPTSSMECSIYFYDLDRTYDVVMARSNFIKLE
jgi:hypothetical protein